MKASDLNKDSEFCWKNINGKIHALKQTVKNYSTSDDTRLENWDGYNADKITPECSNSAVKALECLDLYFKKNCGLLNNRWVEIDTTPMNDGCIEIKLIYQEVFVVCIECCKNYYTFWAGLNYMLKLDGTKTINDRDFELVFSNDAIYKTNAQITDVKMLLDEVFFKHKWKF